MNKEAKDVKQRFLKGALNTLKSIVYFIIAFLIVMYFKIRQQHEKHDTVAYALPSNNEALHSNTNMSVLWEGFRRPLEKAKNSNDDD